MRPNNKPNIFTAGVLAASTLVFGACGGIGHTPENIASDPICSYPGPKFEDSTLFASLEEAYGNRVWVDPNGKFCTDDLNLLCTKAPHGVPMTKVIELTKTEGQGIVYSTDGSGYYCVYNKGDQ